MRVLGLDALDRVAAERQPQRRSFRIHQCDERIRELARVAALAVIDVGGMRAGLTDGVAVIIDLVRGARQRTVVEEVGTEETGLDHGDMDAERRHFAGQSLADALDRELGRAIDAPAGIAGIAADRGEIDDVAIATEAVKDRVPRDCVIIF